jgi:asparagine synthase (glutamine-hydrolysing)
MREVHPGTVVTVNRTNRDTAAQLLHAADPPAHRRPATSIATVRCSTTSSPPSLVADVPHCMLLSGRLDSSVLTALAAAQLGE